MVKLLCKMRRILSSRTTRILCRDALIIPVPGGRDYSVTVSGTSAFLLLSVSPPNTFARPGDDSNVARTSSYTLRPLLYALGSDTTGTRRIRAAWRYPPLLALPCWDLLDSYFPPPIFPLSTMFRCSELFVIINTSTPRTRK